MGEAKRRREYRERAYAEARPVGRPEVCPGCGSKRIRYFSPAALARAARGRKGAPPAPECEIAGCFTCRAIWEPFPKAYIEDEVAAEPCDNCAFRPGSPEQADADEWRALIDQLRPDEHGWFSGRFYCHKNVPIDQAQGAGNFLFPRRPDGTPDITRMRVCSGFLRVFWALAEKQERDSAAGDGAQEDASLTHP